MPERAEALIDMDEILTAAGVPDGAEVYDASWWCGSLRIAYYGPEADDGA